MTNKNQRFRCAVENVKNYLFIRADGKIAPCLGLVPWAIRIPESKHLGSYHKTFWDKFNKKFYSFDFNSRKCSNCKYADTCSICTATDLMENNPKDKKDNYWYYLNIEREKVSAIN